MNMDKSATQLSRNPLGIIALFILLIYGFATMLFGIAGNNLSSGQRWWFVIFLIIFPVVVLIVFTYLVVFHHEKLYAPSEFKDESNFMGQISPQEKQKMEEKEIQEETVQLSTVKNKTISEQQYQKRFKELKQKSIRYENLVYEYYEKKYDYDINRNIYYKINDNKIFFDGIVERNGTITFMKIKYLPNNLTPSYLLNVTVINAIKVKTLLMRNGKYQNYRLLFTFIVDTDDAVERSELSTKIHNMIDFDSINIGIRVLSISQLEKNV